MKLVKFILLSGVLTFTSAANDSNNAEGGGGGDVNSPDVYFDRATTLIRENQIEEAVELLNKAVEASDGSGSALYRRGALLSVAGWDSAALQDMNRVIEEKPDFHPALWQRAKIHARGCQLHDAESDLHRLLAIKSDHEEGQSLMQKVAEAISALKEADKLVARSAGEYEHLANLLNTVIAVCSQDGNLRMRNAEANEKSGQIAMAIASYSRATVLINDNLSAYKKMAELHTVLGEIERATASWKGCLHLDPENKDCAKPFKKLKKLTRSYEAAEEAFGVSKFRDALGPDALDIERKGRTGVFTLIDELKIEGEFLAKSLKMACDCLSKLKRKEQALSWCKDAFDRNPEDIDTGCNLGDAQILDEDYEGAVRTFGQVQELPGGRQNKRARDSGAKAQRLLRQSKKKDYYKILGVKRDATAREIKKAYRSKSKQFHPDRYKGSKEEAEKLMSDINQAYEVLSNDELKQRYDMGDDPNDPEGSSGFGGGGGHPFGGGGFGGPIFFEQGAGGGGGGGFQFHFGGF